MRWLTRAFGGDARAPRDLDTALRAALLAILDRDFDRAEQCLSEAVRSDANDVDLYLALARLYRSRGEIGRSIRVHQNLLLRTDLGSERRSAVLCELGADFAQGGFTQRAIATYDEVIAARKRDPRALLALVELSIDADDPARALEFQRRLERVDPANSGHRSAVDLLLLVARHERRVGEFAAARKAVRKALRADEARPDAWLLLGQIERDRGRTKAALTAWVRAVRQHGIDASDVYAPLGETYAELGRSSEFEALLRERLETDPDDSAARRALAGSLVEHDSQAALVELRTLLERDPEDLRARVALARLLLSERGKALHDVDAIQEYTALADAIARSLGAATAEPGA